MDQSEAKRAEANHNGLKKNPSETKRAEVNRSELKQAGLNQGEPMQLE